MGGSALAQVFCQIGFDSADIGDFNTLNAAVEVTQTLIESEPILSGHERFDGGLATTSLEMAFAGTCSST
jgi:phosphoribosylformylglycinamidine synthase